MLLTHKTKIKLTKEQVLLINLASNEGRMLYNHLLNLKKKHYEVNKTNLSYFTLQKTLKNYKTQYLTYDAKKEICRILENNYKSFFSLLKNKALTPQPPNFRGEKYFFTLSYTQDFIIKGNQLIISLLGRKHLDINLEYILPIVDKACLKYKTKNSEIKQLKLTKIENEYYVCVSYETKEPQQTNNKSFIAIDLGQSNLITYYDVPNNKGVIYSSKKLNYLQQYYDKRIDKLKSIRDKKIKNSKRRLKVNKKIKYIQAKKSNTVKTTLHKLSKKIVDLDTNIIIGELTNLKQNALSFNKQVNRQKQNNWNLTTITNLLEYKTKLKGNQFVKVNEAWTSKTCSICGNINQSLSLKDRTYQCSCGNNIDRDINASINIFKVYENNSGDYHSPIDFSKLEESKRYDWVEMPNCMKLSN